MKVNIKAFCEVDKYAVESYKAIHNVTDKENLGDITEVEISSIPKGVDLLTHGSPCFPEGVKVRTQEGYKNIEDIIEGDRVLTHKNRYRGVYDLHKTKSKDIYNIKVQGSPIFPSTGNHPFYIRVEDRGIYKSPNWMELRDVIEGSMVGVAVGEEVQEVDNQKVREYLTKREGIREIEVATVEEALEIGYLVVKEHKRPYKIEGREGEYTVKYSLEDQEEIKGFYEDGHVWFPIESIEKVETEGVYVYNMEVEEDHTYTVNNIIVHNCQDYSQAGSNAGGNVGSGTRSSLMWNSVEIIRVTRPKIVIWENVKNVLSKRHRHNFEKYLEDLNNIGYNNYYEVLNAREYGEVQNRERIFVVSILKEIDTGSFKFPEPVELKRHLKEVMETEVDERYYLTEKQINAIKNSTFNQNRKRIQEKEYCDTLCARDYKDPKCIEIDGRVRKITPREYWRIMGFTDEDFEKAQSTGNSNSQLYKQAGNSVSVKVLEAIYKELQKAQPEEIKDGMDVISLFSGVGAFEMALEKL